MNTQKGNSTNAALTGLFLGATAAALYLFLRDKSKKEKIKDTINQAKKTALQKLDYIQERLETEKDQAEDELKEIRKNGRGLNIH